MGCKRKDTNETSVCSQDIWEFSMSPAAATVSNCGASDSDVSALCIRFVRKKKELLRCDIATVSPRRSSAKNHVLEELHVVMNRICISTYVNVIFYILMYLGLVFCFNQCCSFRCSFQTWVEVFYLHCGPCWIATVSPRRCALQESFLPMLAQMVV